MKICAFGTVQFAKVLDIEATSNTSGGIARQDEIKIKLLFTSGSVTLHFNAREATDFIQLLESLVSLRGQSEN